MTNEEKKEAYNVLDMIAHQIADLHNTVEYWMQKLLSDIDWKDEE
jgi:hypothetical protein